MLRETPKLDQILEEIANLKQAQSLLEDLWIVIGPYRDGVIPDKTWYAVQNYFKFDDSE